MCVNINLLLHLPLCNLPILYSILYSPCTVGSIPFLLVAELFEAKYVATAMSMACIVNWGCNFFVGVSFLFLRQYLGPWVFGFYSFSLAVTAILTYIYLPGMRVV